MFNRRWRLLVLTVEERRQKGFPEQIDRYAIGDDVINHQAHGLSYPVYSSHEQSKERPLGIVETSLTYRAQILANLTKRHRLVGVMKGSMRHVVWISEDLYYAATRLLEARSQRFVL
jgi:hypothetical protein